MEVERMLTDRDIGLLKWGFCEGREYTLRYKGDLEHEKRLESHIPLANNFIDNIDSSWIAALRAALEE
jgi:hypothetical protein